MRVCLVRCPSPFLIDEKVFPPLGLMAAGTYLKSHGHEVMIYDWATKGIPSGYDLYGFGPTTPEYLSAVELRKVIKQSNPKAMTVIGGPHATLDPDACRKEGFDVVFVGRITDYSIIDRTLVDIKSYKYFINGRLATTVMTSFGCPYRCAFCAKTYDSVTLRDADDVIKEIEYLHREFDYNALMFFDDIFIIDKSRTEKICARLKELGIVWRCFVRGDLIVRHGKGFVEMMADSGCVEVGMGIESGSDKILSIIHKGEDIATIKQAILMLKDVGIRVKGFFIVGLPGEDQHTIRETANFLKTVPLDGRDITIFQPYLGSDIRRHREAYDIQWKDFCPSDMYYKGRPGEYHSFVWTSGLKPHDIVKAREELSWI